MTTHNRFLPSAMLGEDRNLIPGIIFLVLTTLLLFLSQLIEQLRLIQAGKSISST
jgi:hypothetical protein